MGNNVTLIPKKPERHSLLTSTENIVYMPLASRASHGIVKIGDGLNITSDAVLSLDLTGDWLINIHTRLDNIVNNVEKIGDADGNFSTKGAIIGENSDGNSIAIGTGANARLTGSISIGSYSRAELGGLAVGAGAKSYGDNSSAFGSEAEASGFKSVALGTMAKTSADMAVQLGQGTNSEYNTLKFRNYTIVDKDGKLKTNTGTASSPIMEIVATEGYVKELISKISGGGITLKVVDVLPTEDIDTNAIHLVPIENPNGNNYYEEYLYVVDKFEMIGTTAIDLSGYVTSEEFNNQGNYKQLIVRHKLYSATYDSETGNIILSDNGTTNDWYNPKYVDKQTSELISKTSFVNFKNALNTKFTADKEEIDGIKNQLGDLNTALETILGV